MSCHKRHSTSRHFNCKKPDAKTRNDYNRISVVNTPNYDESEGVNCGDSSASSSSYTSDVAYCSMNPPHTKRTQHHHKYLNFEIIVLRHEDVPFLIIADRTLLTLLGYKNDHVVRNNVSPSNKFKPNDVFQRHKLADDVWLLNKTGLCQLMAATNNKKIDTFKNWLKREVLDDSSLVVDATTNITQLSASRATVNLCYHYDDDDGSGGGDRIEVRCCWKNISPELREKIIQSEAVNARYDNNRESFNTIVAYIDHIISRDGRNKK